MSADYAALSSDERIVGGARLQPVHTATTVRVQAAESLVTDAPFADTKEAFGGYYIVSADDQDAALALPARIPAARPSPASHEAAPPDSWIATSDDRCTSSVPQTTD